MTRRNGLRYLAVAAGILLLAVVLLSVSAPFPDGMPEVGATGPAQQSGLPEREKTALRTASVGTQADAEALAAVSPEMRQQLADVARAYASNARFPDYATPLHANDWAQLHPRAFVPRAGALQNVPGVTASVVLDRYIVDRAGDLAVQVLVVPDAGSGVTASGVRVTLQRNGQRSSPVVLGETAAADAAGTSGQTFAGVLPAALVRTVPAGEVAVVAELSFAGGQRSAVTAMVRLYDAVAHLVGVGGARVEGANLVVPAHFQVVRAGYYRVEANLFAAGGQVPVSHLNAEFPLAAGNSEGLLKVHAVTLREAGEAGPYVLRDIDISRVPDQPGEATDYGTVAGDAFAVRGYPLDAYSNEPWVDPQAQERLAFLQRLGRSP